MFSSPDELPPYNYFTLKTKVLKDLRTARADDALIELLRKSYGGVLNNENLVLSRSENERLFKQIAKEMFEELLKKI